MAYTYEQIFAADPSNPANVAQGASVTIFAPGDGTMTPLTITDPDGQPLANPITVNSNGFGPAFAHATLDRVAWAGGSFTGFFTSYEGIKEVAVAAQTAAEDAATNAGAAAQADLEARIAAGFFQGQPGADGSNVLPTDTAIKDAINNTASETRGALNTTIASSTGLNVKTQFGAVGNGVADDTAAIQAAINAAAPGQAVIFPATGSGAYYKITAGLTITTPNVRLIGQPRDGYAMSIRCATASTTILTVKASGVVLQDIAFMGDVQAVNGVGATVNGVELFGSTDGDLDALVKGCTFQWMANPVRLRGRNATVENSLFSNTLNGVIIDGKDAVYHVGANAAENRGNLVRNNRFHNIGANANNSAVEITANTKVLHAVIEGNHFDSTGGGRHIKATGTAGNLHGGITFLNNKHTEAQADAYHLTYVQNSVIDGAYISAFTATTFFGSAVILANCDTIRVGNVFVLQMGNSGIVATSSNRIHVHDTRFRAIGLNTGTTGHGLDFNSGNSQCRFDRVTVETTDGYGFNGDPGDSEMTDCEFRSCTLGNINSLTLRNRAARGTNVYIEGTGGRKQDSASKSFDLEAGVATPLATITGGSAYSSFEVEVKVIGRNSAGNLYARYIRYVRPENGTPVYVTPIADVAQGTITLAFATSGTTGVTVSATATGSTAFVTAHVTAFAGGGAATGNARGVTVAMA